MNWMEKRIVKNSDAVVTLSYELQKKGRRWGVDCHYIPNGADIPPTLTIEQSEQLKQARLRNPSKGVIAAKT